MLKLAVKGMNSTAGPNGLVPTQLVFGVLPRIHNIPGNKVSLVEQMHSLKKSRKEMDVHIEKARCYPLTLLLLPPVKFRTYYSYSGIVRGL